MHGNNDELLRDLIEKERPEVSLMMLAAYINGIYRASRLRPWVSVDPIRRDRIDHITELVKGIRENLSGERQREIDLYFLRFVRRYSCVSVVIGAGAAKDAGGLLWDELVKKILVLAIERGHEITQTVPTADSPQEPPLSLESLNVEGIRRWTFERSVIRTERLSAEAEQEARQIIGMIDSRSAGTEDLKNGAQLCVNLWGQHTFAHMTDILYGACPRPSPIHEAIAELADAQYVPGRGPNPLPGWWTIVTYNFDDLMGEALDNRRLPRAAYAMRGMQMCGDPNIVARGDRTWHVPIYHLHGYTPRRLFLITNTRYVFSTSQYNQVYGGPRVGVLECAFKNCLTNPNHLALYVGCSFKDPKMNDLLRESATRLPGRRHHALIEWPD